MLTVRRQQRNMQVLKVACVMMAVVGMCRGTVAPWHRGPTVGIGDQPGYPEYYYEEYVEYFEALEAWYVEYYGEADGGMPGTDTETETETEEEETSEEEEEEEETEGLPLRE